MQKVKYAYKTDAYFFPFFCWVQSQEALHIVIEVIPHDSMI